MPERRQGSSPATPNQGSLVEALTANLATLRPKRLTVESSSLRPAAVLVPLRIRENRLHALLTRRPLTLKAHPGQVAFPGGKLERDEDALQGALREAWEELGIPGDQVVPLGSMNDVRVVTGYRVTPWVGRIPPDLELRPDPREVARAFEVPVRDLVDPTRTRFSVRPYPFRGTVYQTPYFEWQDEVIWGATGKIVLELLDLLGLAPPEPSEA